MLLPALRRATSPSWLALVATRNNSRLMSNMANIKFDNKTDNRNGGQVFKGKTMFGSGSWKTFVLGGSIALGTAFLFSSSTLAETNNETDKDVDRKSKLSSVPVTSLRREMEPLPSAVDYLLVGGGTASFTASRAIRAHEPRASVLIVSEEEHTPYMRPPLSKELWYTPEDKLVDEEIGKLRFRQWNGKYRYVHFEPDQFYVDVEKLVQEESDEKDSNNKKGGVAVLKGRKVAKVDAWERVAFLEDGAKVQFKKCLLATGGRPKTLPVLERTAGVVSKVSTYRTMGDFMNLRKRIKHYKRIAVIGGGFLGSELACALAYRAKKDKLGLEIVQIFPEKGNLAQLLPAHLSDYASSKLREEGVQIFTETEIKGAYSNSQNNLVLQLSNDRSVEVDHAVVAVGLEANTELADVSGLEVDSELGGFKVNAELEARNNIFAAGDVATFYDVRLGKRRLEHHDHAIVSGRLAGENMASGQRKPYVHQSIFWSDLGPEIGFEAIGNTNGELNTVAVFAMNEKHQEDKEGAKQERNKYSKGVVFYLDEKERVVGLVLWNLFNKMGVARRIIQEHKRFPDLADLAKHFDLHGDDFSD